MLVATVTLLSRPAWATMSASRACCLAFSTSWGMPRFCSCWCRYSDFSTEIVPTSTGWPGLVALGEVVDDGLELGDLGLVDEVGLVVADHRLVGRDGHDLQAVGVHQLGRLGRGRTGHAGELVVHAEVVLQGDRGEGLVLLLDLHALLGLDGLVQTLAPAPALEDAAGELVDDLHLAAADDVVLVPLVQLLGLQRRRELVDEVLLHLVVEVLDAEGLLDLLDARLERGDRALLLVDLVVSSRCRLRAIEANL